MTLYLEIRAVRLPGAGRLTLSLAPVLALTQLGQPAPACLFWLAAATLRQLVNGHPSLRLLETLSEWTPSLLALAVTLYAPYGPIAGGLTYICLRLLSWDLLAQELPAPLAASQRTVQARLVYFWPALWAAGLALAQLSPANMFLFWPILELLRQSAGRAVLLEEQVQRQDVVRQLERSQSNLERAADQQKRLLQDVRGLEAASAALMQVQTPQQTADELLRLCQKLVPGPSLAVFLHEQLPPQLPLVGLALSSGTVQQASQPEEMALAFPLGRLGVLYAVKKHGPFQDSELRSLSQAASQGALGLARANHLQALNDSLQQLQNWTNAVDWLLRQAIGFLDQLERPLMIQRLTEAVQSTFPHDSLEICLDGRHSLALCQQAIEQRAPLLIADLSQTQWTGHQPGQRSLLCVPIYHPGLSQVGLIILGAQNPGVFTRLHCDLLSLLGFLAAAAWKNAELYAETRSAQAQLIQSGKMAAVGQLAAGVAHELNTPLASIALSLDMSKRLFPKNPDSAYERLDKANEMVDKARQIVNTLLYYSRQATAGRRPTELDKLIRETLDLMRHPLSLEGVEVEFTPAKLPDVPLNQNEIQQVLFNLLLNARDALKGSPKERKTVRMHLTRDEKNTTITVSDQGPGIPPEVQERIFDPFFTTKPVGEGTGLGLSISQQIVQAHHGSLSCRSSPQGTQFSLSLPNQGA